MRITAAEAAGQLDPLLSARDAAAYLGTTERWVRSARFDGRLPAVVLGGSVLRFRRSALDELIAEGSK